MTIQQMLDLVAYYRRVKRIYDRSMDMIGHHTQERHIVTGNTDVPSPTDSRGSTKALAVEPILIDRHHAGVAQTAEHRSCKPDVAGSIPATSSDWMEIIDPAQETSPRTVQHATVNGVGPVARVLRGKR